MGWFRSLLHASCAWIRDVRQDRDIVADMNQARAEGRPPPGATSQGSTACRRYIAGHPGPTACEWPYCTCTAGLTPANDQVYAPESNPFAQVVQDSQGAPLVCYGCAHSRGRVPYPSAPSGERPCLFCTRNPEQEAQLVRVQANLNPGVVFTARYDNGPTRTEAGDQYIATDRLRRDVEPAAHIVT